MKTSKPLAIALAALTALALLTGAVAAPILCRPFYYAHIGPLRLAERTGYTEHRILHQHPHLLLMVSVLQLMQLPHLGFYSSSSCLQQSFFSPF